MVYRVWRQHPVVIIPSLLFVLLIVLLSSCTNWMGFPTYYDATTYKNLTDLKPEVLIFYDTFSKENIDSDKIGKINLKFAQIYEYEKGKGEKNRETYVQIRMIQEMFNRHIKDRYDNGIWSNAHLENQKENIAEAFDIAIRTERQKNKNE